MSSNVTSLIERQRPWWHAEPNPACWAWCRRDHAPDELATTTSLICLMEVDRAESYLVEVVAVQMADEDTRGGVVVYEPQVSVRDAGDMSPASVVDLERALRRARQILADLGWRS